MVRVSYKTLFCLCALSFAAGCMHRPETGEPTPAPSVVQVVELEDTATPGPTAKPSSVDTPTLSPTATFTPSINPTPSATPARKRRTWVPQCRTFAGILGPAGEAEGESREPPVLAASANDDLYLWHCQTNQVLRLDSHGAVKNHFEFPSLRAMAILPSGELFLAGPYGVWRMDVRGREVFHFGKPGRASQEFDGIWGLAFDGTGFLYVGDANGGIQVYDAQGRFQRAWKRAPELKEPRGMACDFKGNVYVADQGARSIFKFNGLGKMTGQIPVEGRPQALAIDKKGRLHVLTLEPGRVHILTPLGRGICTFGADGDRSEDFQHPSSLAVDTQGRDLVAEGYVRSAVIKSYVEE